MDAVFLGDSWLDEEWNEHETFGSILAESRHWTFLNISKAGAETVDIFKKLKDTSLQTTENTQWFIHLGGNDLLYWVIKNPSLVGYDVWRESKPYFKKKGEDIAQNIFKIVEYIISNHGGNKIMISSNTACYGVPLCRAFGILYTPFNSRKHMNQITSVVNLALLKMIKDIQCIYPKVHFTFYNECRACYDNISWKWDMFHPCKRSHKILASACSTDLSCPIDQHIEYFKKLQEFKREKFFLGFFVFWVFLVFLFF